MAEFREKVAEAGAPQPSNPLQASVERILMSYGDQSFQELSRYRFAEEREWYEEALFYQRRQWLKWNDSTRRFDVIKQDPDRPKPMPVTNHYARTVNANANQLQKPRMAATAMDDSDANRRGAEFAQRAIKAIDAESGMDVLRPKLAKHDVLWGLGVTKDIIDTSKGTGIDQVAEFSTETAKRVSCLDCGRTSQVGGAPGGPGGSAPSPAGNQGQDADQAKPNMSLGDSGTMEPPEESTAGLRCPLCGSPNVTPYEAKTLGVANVHEFPKGKICTEIPPIFEIYLPRDCRDPNLAKRIIQRYRKPLGTLRSLYGDRAANIKAEAPYDVHQVYMEALRALVNYNYMHEQTIESTTITEVWADWDELPRKVQQRLEQFWEEDTESLEMAIRCGIYEIYAGGSMLDWGPNPWWDEVEQVAYKPYTFFLWELDPATVYNKGQGTDLVPLQKRLNRLDSLIELAFMCNAAGKWLWPTTQTGKPPSGSPNEVVGYEVIGEGKTKPEFVAPKAIDDNAFMLRMSILNDFEQIGNTLGVSQGQAPAGVKAFRGLAYLGQKAEEQINTQRGLWEKGHELRYKKCLLMAQKCWDAPRKVKIAGYNGKFGMMMLDGNALKGQYTLEFVADSSRPQLPSEKEAAFGKLLTAGMVDITDSAVREYVADTLNLDDVNMTDHLQYLKAERDLEKIKQGQIPQESPFQKWDVFLKVFANFALTEEFEALDPIIQQGILMYASHLSQMAQMAQMAAMQQMGAPGGAPNPQQKAQALGKAMTEGKSKGGPESELEKVPGEEISSGGAQRAAAARGQEVRAALP